MNKTSEAFDSARSEYIEGYVEKNKHIFPTLALVAREFNVSFSTLRKKAANEGWYKKRKHHQNSREEFEMRKQFKGEYSKLAQVSRNYLVFVEYFQTAINKEIEAVKINFISSKFITSVLVFPRRRTETVLSCNSFFPTANIIGILELLCSLIL